MNLTARLTSASTIAKRMLICATLLLVAVFSAACSVGAMDITITFNPNQEWKAESHWFLNQQEIAMLGTTADVELQKQAATLNARGVKYEWHKQNDGANTTYVITVDGKGLLLLNELIFNNRATIQSSGNTITLLYQEIGLSGFRPLTLRLTGGTIISSNADKVNGNTAIWYNLKYGDTIEAKLTEASKGLSLDSIPEMLGTFFQGILNFFQPQNSQGSLAARRGEPYAYIPNTGNQYPEGQCTWYAWERRLEINRPIPHFEGDAGNAMNWATSAKNVGFRVDHVPQVGDVAVFPPNSHLINESGQSELFAGALGHVAFVEEVQLHTEQNPIGFPKVTGYYIKISEQNGRAGFDVTGVRYAWVDDSVWFIH